MKGSKLQRQTRAALAERIRERRELAGRGQAQIALALGVTYSQYRRYELGQTSLDIGDVVAIANAIGCAPGDLLSGVLPGGDGAEPTISSEGIALARAYDALESESLKKLARDYLRDMKKIEDKP